VTTTGADGSFVANIDYEGPIIAILVRGSYVDEATGQRVAVDNNVEMSVVTVAGAGVVQAVITPLTHLAANQARNNMANGQNPSDAINNANFGIAEQFGLGTGVDISKIVPTDVNTDDLDPNSVEGLYGLIIAGLSMQAKNNGLSPSSVMALLSSLADDLRDGVINSYDIGALQQAIIDFLNSARNSTGVSAIQVNIQIGSVTPSPFSAPPEGSGTT
jgi:hypothetical protein